MLKPCKKMKNYLVILMLSLVLFSSSCTKKDEIPQTLADRYQTWVSLQTTSTDGVAGKFPEIEITIDDDTAWLYGTFSANQRDFAFKYRGFAVTNQAVYFTNPINASLPQKLTIIQQNNPLILSWNYGDETHTYILQQFHW